MAAVDVPGLRPARSPRSTTCPVSAFCGCDGRCASCGFKISPRYPVVEAFAAVLGLVVAYVFGPTWQTVAALGFTWTLLALTLIDLDHKLLPDSMTLPLLWAGLLVNVPGDGAPCSRRLLSSVIGAAAGYLALWSVYQLFKLVTGKEGMGYGDFKLLAAHRRVGRLAAPAARDPALGGRRQLVGIALIALRRAIEPHADSVRPLSCGRGLHRATVGRASRAALRGVVLPLGSRQRAHRALERQQWHMADDAS